jgi:hypothetical protein
MRWRSSESRTEAESDVQRESAIETFRNTLSTRHDDKRCGVIVVIMQRLNELDLSVYLLELGGWEHLLIQGEYGERRTYVFPRSKDVIERFETYSARQRASKPADTPPEIIPDHGLLWLERSFSRTIWAGCRAGAQSHRSWYIRAEYLRLLLFAYGIDRASTSWADNRSCTTFACVLRHHGALAVVSRLGIASAIVSPAPPQSPSLSARPRSCAPFDHATASCRSSNFNLAGFLLWKSRR